MVEEYLANILSNCQIYLTFHMYLLSVTGPQVHSKEPSFSHSQSMCFAMHFNASSRHEDRMWVFSIGVVFQLEPMIWGKSVLFLNNLTREDVRYVVVGRACLKMDLTKSR